MLSQPARRSWCDLPQGERGRHCWRKSRRTPTGKKKTNRRRLGTRKGKGRGEGGKGRRVADSQAELGGQIEGEGEKKHHGVQTRSGGHHTSSDTVEKRGGEDAARLLVRTSSENLGGPLNPYQ